MSDKILVHNIPLSARVGCLEHERLDPQQIFIDIELTLDIRKASASDSIDDATNYVDIRNAAAEVVADRPYHLIETIAEKTAAKLLEEFSAEEVLVRVKKPYALARYGVPFAAVEITRRRDG